MKCKERKLLCSRERQRQRQRDTHYRRSLNHIYREINEVIKNDIEKLKLKSRRRKKKLKKKRKIYMGIQDKCRILELQLNWK